MIIIKNQIAFVEDSLKLDLRYILWKMQEKKDPCLTCVIEEIVELIKKDTLLEG